MIPEIERILTKFSGVTGQCLLIGSKLTINPTRTMLG
jgi:hypothetical protein